MSLSNASLINKKTCFLHLSEVFYASLYLSDSKHYFWKSSLWFSVHDVCSNITVTAPRLKTRNKVDYASIQSPSIQADFLHEPREKTQDEQACWWFRSKRSKLVDPSRPIVSKFSNEPDEKWRVTDFLIAVIVVYNLIMAICSETIWFLLA